MFSVIASVDNVISKHADRGFATFEFKLADFCYLFCKL